MATIYRYPLKRMSLEDSTDYVKINCYKYEPPGVGALNSDNFSIPTSDTNYDYRTIGTRDLIGTILLPIPQNIPNNSQSTDWSSGQLNALTASAVGSALNVIKSPDFVKQLPKEVMGFINKVTGALQTGTGQSALEQFFASKSIEALTGQDVFGQVLKRQGGVVFNENIELLFNGVDLRAPFELSFDLAPRSVEEQREIKNIVVFLKREMSARKGTNSGEAGGIFLTAPSVFKVEYMSGKKEHPFLNRYKICALTNLSLNFTGSNTYSTYSDGTPVHMIFSLQFQELTPIYAEDYVLENNPEANLGVAY